MNRQLKCGQSPTYATTPLRLTFNEESYYSGDLCFVLIWKTQ